MRTDFAELFTPHCVACGEPIPADHPKPRTTLTCSDACSKKREQFRRNKADAKRCRYCFRPSTLAERARFRRWRNYEKKNPPPDAELSPEELDEREYLKANPPQKRGPKPKEKVQDAAAVQRDVE